MTKATPSTASAASASETLAATPTEEAPVRTLMVGVDIEDLARELKEKMLDRANLSIDWHWTDNTEKLIPPACEFVLVVTDFCSHAMAEDVPLMAKAAGVPFVRCASKWAVAQAHIERERAKVYRLRGIDKTARWEITKTHKAGPMPGDIAKILGVDSRMVVNAIGSLSTEGVLPKKKDLQWDDLHSLLPLIELRIMEHMEAVELAQAAKVELAQAAKFELAQAVLAQAQAAKVELAQAAKVELAQAAKVERASDGTATVFRTVATTVTTHSGKTISQPALQIKMYAAEIQKLLALAEIREVTISADEIMAKVVRVDTVTL